MLTIIEELKEKLTMKGYNIFSELEAYKDDNTTIFLASSDEKFGDKKIVYVKVFGENTDLSFDVQDAALIEAQYHEEAPDFIWATNGEVNYYADCIESEPLAEIPAVIDVTKKKDVQYPNKICGHVRRIQYCKNVLMICMKGYMDQVEQIILVQQTKQLMN